MTVTAVRVGRHVNHEHSHCRRVCIRCGVEVMIPERQARKDTKNGVKKHDFRCEDCAPVKYWR